MVKALGLQALSCVVLLFTKVALTAATHGNPQRSLITDGELDRRNDSSTLTLATVTNDATWRGWKGVENMFVFGASNSDTKFDPTKGQPNDTYPLGNPFTNSSTPPYGTFTNGPNWISYLTFKYNESLIYTYNMARSGAVVNTTAIGQNQPIDLIHQITDRFVPNYVTKNEVGWNASNSLFVLWFGTNDVDRTYNQRNVLINVAVFKSYLRQLEKLYKLGARNFLLCNMTPINRGPHKVEPDISLEGQYINDYNWRMNQMFKQFTSTHDDISVLLFDLGTLYSQVLDNPAAYPQTANIKNTTGACAAYEPNDKDVPSMDYKDPSCPYAVNEYFWLNGLHPTSSVHEVHAAQVALALAYNS
ncbi:MAG: hypothetical protein Q9226_006844 [Calogaya cf. arnoldii]